MNNKQAVKLGVLAVAGALLAGCGLFSDGGESGTAAGLSLVAGNIGGAGSIDGVGSAARFNQPYASAVDAGGNVYVADSGNDTIRRIAPDGTVTTLAGQPGVCGHADGQGSAATFCRPQGIAVGSDGNIYVADTYSGAVREVTPAGVVSTLAGSVSGPIGLVADAAGNLYTLASVGGAYAIEQITLAGVVNIFAQFSNVTVSGTLLNTAVASNVSGTAVFRALLNMNGGGQTYYSLNNSSPVTLNQNVTVMQLGTSSTPVTPTVTTYPLGLGMDGSGSLYAAVGGTVYHADTSGNVTALGTLPAAHYATGFTVDAGGTLYVENIDTGDVIAMAPNGNASALPCGSGGDVCSANGIAINAGVLYIADANNEIRRLPIGGSPMVLAGMAARTGSADGSGAAAGFNYPMGVAVDGAGNRYVADYGNNTIRRITPAGEVSTLAGQAGSTGYADGVGSAALFNRPSAVAVDAAGNVFVLDSGNNMIRKVSPAGVVSTLAGSGTAGFADGVGSAAAFNFSQSPAFNVINSIGGSPTGAILLALLGLPGHIPFALPVGLAVDVRGNLYVPDTYNSAIRVVSPQGVVTTLAGSPFSDVLGLARLLAPYSGAPGASGFPAGDSDGSGARAAFSGPVAVVRDAKGTLYVADSLGNSIRQVTAGGVVSTLASSAHNAIGGRPVAVGSLNANADLNIPLGLALDLWGDLLIADSGNNRLRLLTPQGAISTVMGNGQVGIRLGDSNPLPGAVMGLSRNGGGFDLTSGNAVLHFQ